MQLSLDSSTQTGSYLVSSNCATTLQLSVRRLSDLVAYCSLYEFEDVIAEVTGADRVIAGHPQSLEMARRAYKLTRYATGSRRLARLAAPHPSIVSLDRDYDLFFPVFNHPHELFALATVPDWRKRCRVAACFVLELWMHLLPRYLLELLSEFDYVFIGVRRPVDEVAKIVKRPVTYLPSAADVLRLNPLPSPPERTIDVCNLGRRSPVTHAALLELARERRIFYYYDTVAASGINQKQRTFRVQSPSEHRLLFGSLLQRSRYYLANRARANEPDFTNSGDELSNRFFEGAAAGAVMLGEPPRGEHFEQHFDWPDAVIPLPFDAPQIGDVIADLDRDPQRLDRIRRLNMHNAALRHDWSHRLRTAFDVMGMPPTPAMLAREAKLQALAAAAIAT